MPLDLNGPATNDAIAKTDEARTELVGDVVQEGDEVRASIEVSHERKRWSVAAAVEWVKGKGFGVRGKGRLRL